MKNELCQINETCPYNSFGKIIIADGGSYPERFGGNCVFQNRELTRLLIKNGLTTPINYTTASQRPHWVTLCKEEDSKGDTYLLDPFVLHIEPINVTQILREGKKKQYPVHPMREDKSSKITVEPTGEQTFDVHLLTLKNDGSKNNKRVLTYSYDISNVHNELPANGYQELAGLRQKKLEMGLLRADGGVTRMYLHPEGGGINMLKIGERKYSQQKHGDDFTRELEAVAVELETDVDTLINFFSDGLNAYIRRQTKS